MHIVTASTKSAEELTNIAMSAKAYWGYSTEFMQDCAEELRVTKDKIQSDAFSYFVAETAQQILGFYCLQKHGQDELELEALFVKPEQMGRGVGKALFEHAMTEASKHQVTGIDIQSDPNAAAFYEAVGATNIGYTQSGSIPGRSLPEYKMELPL